MKYLSVCSGIEAATVAWHPLGWTPAAFSEIEPFPSSVLAHHYPSVPNLGDMTKFKDWNHYDIDVLVGGTPCQSFSVAGLRKGLDDPRGNLMLTYLAIADRYQPEWLVWENVPGVLSSNGGKDFGTFLGGLAELGYGFAYRVLDAQHFGVPQRRRRVFVVGCLGDWRRAAAVLFERHSLQGHPAPRRQSGKGFTHDTAPCLTSSGRGVERGGDTRGQDPVIAVEAFGGNNTSGPIDVATARNACASASASGRMDFESETFITHTLRGEGFDASEDGTGRGTPLVPVSYGIRTANTSSNGWGIQEEAIHTLDRAMGVAVAQAIPFDTTQITSAANYSNPKPGDPCHPLAAQAHVPAIDFDCKASGQSGFGVGEIASTMRAMGHSSSHQNGGGHQSVMTGMQVRRLTPMECERLQGFPDFYTAVPHRGKPAADGPRYKALGNSMAVPCMHWIGSRIQAVESIAQELEIARMA